MKLTASQLRRIIKEEVKRAFEAKKKKLPHEEEMIKCPDCRGSGEMVKISPGRGMMTSMSSSTEECERCIGYGQIPKSSL